MMSVINSVPIIPRIGYKVKSSKGRMVSYSLSELLISSVRYKKERVHLDSLSDNIRIQARMNTDLLYNQF